MKNVKIAIRLDDICAEMDQVRFERMIKLIEGYRITGLLGVVPDNQDPDLIRGAANPCFWNRIKELQDNGWMIGMHGCKHLLDADGKAMLTNRRDSEFAALPYDVQKEKIEKGKRTLHHHGFDVNLFLAPAHSYDMTTLKALKNCGFQYVSDGRSRHCYRRQGLKFVPCRVYGFPGTPKGAVTLAFHSNNCDDANFARITDFLNQHRKDLVSYTELIDEPAGFLLAQLLNEKIYLFYRYYIQERK